MKDKLQERHGKMWEAFDAFSNIALDQIIDEEIAIRRQYDPAAHLPENVQEQLSQNRRAWMEEWGPRGRQMQTLNHIQELERNSAEMDDRYQHYLNSEQEKAGTGFPWTQEIATHTPDKFKENLKSIRERQPMKRPRPG